MSFKKNKYQVLKGIISREIADFCVAYFLNKRKVARFLFDQKYISPFTSYWGVWNDSQVPNTYSHYADTVMETSLQKVQPIMEKHTALKLSPTYSYARIYKKGDVLARHKDRYSCEISTTLNLGGDPWPIYLEPSGRTGQAGIKVDLEISSFSDIPKCRNLDNVVGRFLVNRSIEKRCKSVLIVSG